MATPYCTRQDIEVIFGSLNIERWADLEGKGPTANAAMIAARIVNAIDLASSEIEDILRSRRYKFPLTASKTLTDIVAKMAGIHLHDGRGIIDGDFVDKVSVIRAEVKLKLEQIRNGTIFIVGERLPNAPNVVPGDSKEAKPNPFNPWEPYFGYKPKY